MPTPDPLTITRPFLTASRIGDMTCRQVAILGAIAGEPGLSTSDYAQQLELTKPPITRAMLKMAELGLATTQVDPLDRRKVILAPTSAGRAFLASLVGVAS